QGAVQGRYAQGPGRRRRRGPHGRRPARPGRGAAPMSTRRVWIGLVGGGVALAAGLGFMIYRQFGRIDELRGQVAGLHESIAGSRKLIEGTAALERDVIVLRELSEVMKKILPDNEDVNNLVRTFQKFSEESGVRISGLKKKPNDPRDKGDFDRVAYTISLEA